MGNSPPKISLSQHFSHKLKVWTALSFFGAILFSSMVLFWISKNETKHKSLEIASVIAQAFRSQIISGDFLSLENQAHEAFNLTEDESIVILDTEKLPMVVGKNFDTSLLCNGPNQPCSDFFSRKISVLFPLYYDSEKKSILGYIHLSINDRINWPFMITLVTGVFGSLLLLCLGLLASMSKTFETVTEKLSLWGKELSQNPKAISLTMNSPYSELNYVESALQKLKIDIEKLEKDARTEGKLTVLRGIAHDIKTPVGQLKKMLGVAKAQMTLAGKPTEETIQKFEIYLKKIDRIASQVLVLKDDQIQTNPIYEPNSNLFSLTKSVIEDLKDESLILEKKINLEISGNSDADFKVSKTDLERILTNLARNSAYASADGQTIQFQVNDVSNGAEITVTDQGVGIAPEHIDHIFDIDFSTRPSIGTGLGLPIVKSICEKNNLKIFCKSEMAKGTEFKIFFPKFCGVLNEI